MEHSRLAGVNCIALVSDKEGSYVKVNESEASTVPPFQNSVCWSEALPIVVLIKQLLFKSVCVFVSRSNPLRRTDSPKSGFLSQTWRTTSSRSVGTNSLRKEASGKEAKLERGSWGVCLTHLDGCCLTLPLCASREMSESMTLQNPKGSLLTSSGIPLSLFLLEPATFQLEKTAEL